MKKRLSKILYVIKPFLLFTVIMGMVFLSGYGIGRLVMYVTANLTNLTNGPEEELSTFPDKRYVKLIYTECGHNIIKDIDRDKKLSDRWQLFNLYGVKIYVKISKLCSVCGEARYLSIHNGRIARFQGLSPGGILVEEYDLEVKEIHRAELEAGVPFSDEEELKQLLESFSS